jgi:hypothetical protein
MRVIRGFGVAVVPSLTVLALFIPLVVEADLKTTGVADCSFTANPEEFLEAEQRVYREIAVRANRLNKIGSRVASRTVSAGNHPVRNLVDAEIFDRLAKENVPAAAMSTDQEFVRRIYLDLTGRIPSAAEAREFLENASANKRDALIEKLLYSEEFTDKWTMWMGDWLRNTLQSSNVNRQARGRNAFYNYIRASVAMDKSLKDVAYEVITARGNNYETGPANFVRGWATPNGPIQDTYDTSFSQSASIFLGLGYYDCLLCHNGRGHLDDLSLWGKISTRTQAQLMAAFFSRQQVAGRPGNAPACEAWQSCTGQFFNGSVDITDRVAGGYDLNTTFGNRPNRVAIGSTRQLTPEYAGTGAKPRTIYWREDFAEYIAQDPMFARNVANRLWREIFNLGLVDPPDTLDPARLDPDNPPEGWSLQATHPQLLEKLAKFARESNFQIRPMIRLLVESSAYQLSSRYEGTWSPALVPLFTRHYARRLEGEEVHDAIVKATEVPTPYTIQFVDTPVQWAMQLPEPVEPRSNGANLNFLNTFFRGNRDTQPRRQSGSIQQQLGLMNDAFVTNRLRMSASPKLRAVRELTNEAAIDELFLTFLTRTPSEYEKQQALKFLSAARNRDQAIEDLAWVCINKVEFLFSY